MTTVVLLSGGMDSTTLLFQAAYEEGWSNVRAVGFEYGQRHIKEVGMATVLCGDYGVPYTRFKLDQRPFFGSALTAGGNDVPHGHYAADNMKSTVVPNRNATFLATAFAYAVSIQAEKVATAVHAGDHPIYPDCRPEFLNAFQRMEEFAIGPGCPQLWAPYQHLTKAQIALEGYAIGVPYERTWSCYEGGEVHCGRCGTCVERKEAFRVAGVADPTNYRDEEFEIAAYRG